MRDSLLSVFVNNAKPETMEAAISAAEGYAAILAKDETDLPEHPDDRSMEVNRTWSSLVMASAAGPKQPNAKPTGRKTFSRKERREFRRRKEKEGKKDHWVNSNPMMEMMMEAFEDMCRMKGGGGEYQEGNGGQPGQGYFPEGNRPQPGQDNYSEGKGQGKPFQHPTHPQGDQRGYQKPAEGRGHDGVPRCYKCRKPGHIRRECVFADDDSLGVQFFCDEHVPLSADYALGAPVRGTAEGPNGSPKEKSVSRDTSSVTTSKPRMQAKDGDSHDREMERDEKGIPMTRAGYKNVNLRVETTPELTYQRLALNVNSNKNTPSTLICRTDIQVHGVLIDCIIDTGATRTMLSHSIYEKLKNLLGVLEITEVTLLSASGDRCKLLGEILLPFQLRGVSYTQKVLVA